MKRIVTGFLLSFFAFAMSANAQLQTTSHAVQKTVPQATMMNQAQTASSAVKPGPSPDNNDQPLSSSFKTEAVSYLGDTSGGNWWVYAPILNRSTGDSLGYFHFATFNDGELLYFTNDDSIGPVDIGLTQTTDTIAFDTMYNRVMGIRVSPPKDLGTTVKLDSANVIFYPESMSPNDMIRVWAVQVSDDPGGYPFPDLLSAVPIAEESIPASEITVGQMNSLTVSFGGKSLTTASEKNEIAICVFVDGPDFSSDTIGYFLEADPNDPAPSIDTDGTSANPILDIDGNPIAMRTYLLGLDGGNLSIENNPPNYVGGGGSFFVSITQVDPTGAPTGQYFSGNIGITSYFHGTALAGISPNDANPYSLGAVYPNPVSASTEINYNLGASGPVTLEVYNVLGENVGTLVNSIQGAGEHTATFSVGALPDGMYYYKLQSGEFTATNTMVIAR